MSEARCSPHSRTASFVPATQWAFVRRTFLGLDQALIGSFPHLYRLLWGHGPKLGEADGGSGSFNSTGGDYPTTSPSFKRDSGPLFP